MADRRHPDPKRTPSRAGQNTDDAASSSSDAGDKAASGGYPDTDDLSDTGDAAERLASVEDLDEDASEELRVDNVVGPAEAGVGGGLDEQEEARAGITDEEIAKESERR